MGVPAAGSGQPGVPPAALGDIEGLPVEGFEYAGGAGGGDFAAEVDVGSHGGMGVAELVGGRSGREPGLVHQGGHGFAEGVGGDPVEAGGGEGLAQVGLGVGGVAPAAQGAGKTGWEP